MSPLLFARSLASPGIRHGFFGREGGVSKGLHASLNCGLGSLDDRAAVKENRARVAASFGIAPERLLTCYQVHSAEAIAVTAPWDAGELPKADAMVTRTPGLAIGVLAADCAPILLADAAAGVVAAAHAGWKGALAGIVESTVAGMERLGAERSRIVAAVGPCIGREAYEVGPELEDRFLAADGSYARYFERPAAGERPRFDLGGFVLDRLTRLGIGVVEACAMCTYKNESRLFSFRRATHRSEPDYGRQISAIVVA